MSRSPEASEAVAPPSESELVSVGEPSSEEDAWKSSSIIVQKKKDTSVRLSRELCFLFFVIIIIAYPLRCHRHRRAPVLRVALRRRRWRRSAFPRPSRLPPQRAAGRHPAPSRSSLGPSCL